MSKRNYWQRTVSRRGLLRGAAGGGVGLATAAAIGCGSEEEAVQGTVTATPTAQATGTSTRTPAASPGVRGGRLTFAQTTPGAEPRDPHKALNLGIALWNLMGNRAVVLDSKFKIVPELVESWEIVGDGLEIIMKVQPGANWHNKPPSNGRSVTAEDIAYNLMRISGHLDPENRALYPRAGTLINMTRAEAVDASTVRVIFDKPATAFLGGLADIRNSMVPKDFAEEVGLMDAQKFVGSGAFVVEEFREDQRAIFKRNPDYWRSQVVGQDLPYFDEIRWEWLPDAATVNAAFISGQIDWASGADPSSRDTIMRSVDGAQLFIWPGVHWEHMTLNVTQAPLDDLRVRRALHLAMDYKGINDAERGDGYWQFTGPLMSILPEALQPDEVAQLTGWNPSTKQQDIERAKELLSEAGYAEGALSLEILPLTRAGVFFNLALRIQDHLQKVWPQMSIQIDLPPDQPTFVKRQREGNYVTNIFAIAGQPDPFLELNWIYHSRGSRNYSRHANQRLDSIIEAGLIEFDATRRKALSQEAQQLILDEVIGILTFNMYRYVNIASPKIRGFDGLQVPANIGTDPNVFADRYWKDA